MDPEVEQTYSSILQYLESEESKIILFHRNGDPDALGSSLALSQCFPNISISILGGLNSPAKRISEFLELQFPELSPKEIQAHDMAIILDTSTPSLLEFIPDLPLLVIDHHAHNSGWADHEGVVLYHTNSEKRSCAEVIFELITYAEKEISQKVRTGLAAGILTDTGHLTYSTPETLRTMATILETSDVSLEEIHNALNTEGNNISKRMAKIRAAQRLRVEEFQGIIITISEVNAFEGDAARALISIGSDVAMIGSTRKDQYRISVRANPRTLKKGIHMGSLMEAVGKEVNAEGGGHPGAAGLTGIGDAEAILHVCKEKLKEQLRGLK